MIIKNILFGSLLFISTTGVVLADQVLSYKLTWDEVNQRYRVFMKPSKTPIPNLTTSAQVTIKVPHLNGADRFVVEQVVSNVDGTLWLNNSRVDAPVEAPNSDYISFNLNMVGSPNSFNWQKDTELEVFSFANAGKCTAPISLLNNETDPFAVPNNSASTNPGNQFSNLGWGEIGENNYLDNYQAVADCRSEATNNSGDNSTIVDNPIDDENTDDNINDSIEEQEQDDSQEPIVISDDAPNSQTGTSDSAKVLDYKIVWYNTDNKYHVFMRPSVTPEPVDLSLTGQVTLKVPHGTGADEFKVENLSSAIAGTDWTLASHIKAPEEAPEYDYLSFVVNISNAQAFNWQANQEQEVFSFSNPSTCLGDVVVMPADDPFNQSNNSASTNPGNQFTNLGWGEATDNNYHGTYGVASALCDLHDVDNDGLSNHIERADQDRDNDGINDRDDFDPTGYFYCSSNGKIIKGGTIAVEGPGNVNIISNGSNGYYQFTMDAAGEYIMYVSPPVGTQIDPNYPASNTVLDPTGQSNPYVLGSGEKASTGILSDPSPTTNTPWYNRINVENGDPIIISNNIPLVGTICDDGSTTNDNSEQDDKRNFKSIPTLSEWAQILLTLVISLFAVKGLLQKNKF